ncbi:MAG: nicotinate-nucleotide adenylyltransferase [Pseudomonadota bacterium]
MSDASGGSGPDSLIFPGLARADLHMPHVEPGMRVGLFGGSFNPPHGGHLLVAETALMRLGLDQLWWIVTPGNPLKDTSSLAPLADRMAASRGVIDDRRIKVTAFEATYPSRFTADMIATVQTRNPMVNFVWIMGADNLAQFHRWQHWQAIAASVPIAVIDRPGSTLSFLSAPAAQFLRRHRLDESDAQRLARMDPPAWTFLHGPRSSQSSTALRAKKQGI